MRRPTRRGTKKGRRPLAVVAVLATASLFAACSSSGGSTAASGGVTPRPLASWPASPGKQLPASYATLDEYAKAVTDAETPVTWDGPTTPTKVPPKGYLAAIGCSRTFAGCYVGSDAALAAAKRVGWDGSTTNVENPKDLDQAVQTAILKGATAIVLQGVDQRLIPVGLSQAKAKHIPVVSTFQENTPKPNGIDYEINPNANAMGALLADAMIANNKGNVNVLFLNDNEYGLPVLVLQALMNQLKACTICHVKFAPAINFTADQVTTTLPNRIVSALRNDKTINSMAIGYDPPTTFLIPAINAAGLRSQAQFYSQLGLTLHFIKEQDAFANDTGASLSWGGWAAMDEIFRYLNNQPFVDENIPVQMFNSTNVPDGTAPFTGEASAQYEEKYLALWGRAGS